MKKGKYEKHAEKRAFKLVPMLVVIGLLVVGTVAGTVAYLVARSGSKTNTFSTPVVDASEEITPSGGEITNTGDVMIYIRVAVASNTRTNDGAIDASAAAGVTVAQSSDWFLSDGYYVYKYRMAPGTAVTLPFTAAGSVAELATQYIQAEGTIEEVQKVVRDAWGYTVGSDYNLSN